MTRSIMRQASEDVGALLEHRPDMYVAFNIAPRHLTSDVLIDDIGSIFVGGPISTSQIVLEVTERYEIEDLAATRDLIAELQGLGCRVAIDDVGTGHNGLSYILKLGVDIIKIDKMFVDAIRTETHSQAIIDTLVDLARNLRMQIVAEGVEDFEQVVYLRDHGISPAQGFVFSPPLPGSAFIQLIEAIDPAVPKAPRTVITGEALPETELPQHAAACHNMLRSQSPAVERSREFAYRVIGTTAKEGDMMRTFGAAALLALATVMPVQEAASQDALGGAIFGGAAGAILGGAITGRGSGAAAGALIGAATGAVIANEAARRRNGHYWWRGGCYSGTATATGTRSIRVTADGPKAAEIALSSRGFAARKVMPSGTRPRMRGIWPALVMLIGAIVAADAASAQPINGRGRWCATFPQGGTSIAPTTRWSNAWRARRG